MDERKWRSWRDLAHDYLGWHRPAASSPYSTDGCSLLAKCERCGVRIGQDSNGDWFAMDIFDHSRKGAE